MEKVQKRRGAGSTNVIDIYNIDTSKDIYTYYDANSERLQVIVTDDIRAFCEDEGYFLPNELDEICNLRCGEVYKHPFQLNTIYVTRIQ